MDNQFDPYRDWLHIRSTGRAPTHYELLGLPAFTDNGERVQAAAIERIAHVRKYQVGKHSETAIRLLSEMSQALTCLTNPSAKAEYDRTLRGMATVEDLAHDTLTRTLADVPPVQLAKAHPALEKRSAIVAATEPPPGSSGMAPSAVAKVVHEPESADGIPRLAIAIVLLITGLVTLLGGYGLYRMAAKAISTQAEPIIAKAPSVSRQNNASPNTANSESTTLPGVPANLSGESSAPPPETTPPTLPSTTPRLPGSIPSTLPPTIPTTAPMPPMPAAPALQRGVAAAWQGRIAAVFVDPRQQSLHLLLKLDQPAGETVEAVSSDFAAFLASFQFMSDAETLGQGDRLRVEGTPIDGATSRFTQRSQPLVIQLSSFASLDQPMPAYRAGMPAAVPQLKLKLPLAFLLRMRPQSGLTYEFSAVYKSAVAHPSGDGMNVMLLPGTTDAREVPVHVRAPLANDLRFELGDPVIVHAEVTTEQPPPKLSLLASHLHKTTNAQVAVGTPARAVVNVERHMQMVPLLIGNGFAGVNEGTSLLMPPTMAPPGMAAGLGNVPAAAGAMATPGMNAPGGTPPLPTDVPTIPGAVTKALLTLKDNDNSFVGGGQFYSLAWSADGTRLAAGGGRCVVWDINSGAVIQSLAENVDQLGELRFSPSSQALSLVNSGQEWKLYDLAAGGNLASHRLRSSGGFNTAFSPSGDLFISGATTGPPLRAILPGRAPVNNLPVLIVWDVGKNRQTDAISNLNNVQAVVLSPDGRYLLVGTATALILYQQSGGKRSAPQQVATLPGVQGLWWLPGPNNHFAALTSRDQLGVWDARNVRKPPLYSQAGIFGVASWRRDGKKFVTLSRGVPEVRELADAGKPANIPAPGFVAGGFPMPGLLGPGVPAATGNCRAAVFSPSSNHLALAYSDGRVVIRDEDAGSDVATFSSGNQATTLAWSPDGTRLASAQFGQVSIWDTSQFAGAAPAEPAAAGDAPQAAAIAATMRDEVSAQIKEAQQAIRDKDWSTANSIVAQLEDQPLNAAEKTALLGRVKKALTQKAELLIQQANRIKGKDPDKAQQLLSEAMEVDPDGVGKQAAKALGL